MVAFSLLQLVGEYLFTQKVREELRTTENLAYQMVEPLRERDADALFEGVLSASQDNEAQVLVLDAYGVVQADALSQKNGHRVFNAEVVNVLNGTVESDYRYYEREGGVVSKSSASSVFGWNLYGEARVGVYAAAIKHQSQTIGVLVYISSVDDLHESLALIRSQILMWLTLVALAVAVLSWLISRVIITNPIVQLNQGIQKMTKGDFSVRVNEKGNSEFSRLAHAFNIMCQRLEDLDKSRNEFVSNASHELKTPLSTMKILIETLMYQEDTEPEMLKEFLQDINKEIDRLNRVISDLLTLTNIDSTNTGINTQNQSISMLISETVKRLAPLARERGITLESVIKEDVTAQLDPISFQQVIYNLVDNAIKYTGRGGNVRIGLSRTGKKAIIQVSDTGMGIPQEDQLHIFDRFYRVDKARSRETGGTGLGLSITKQIVTMHNGTISVESEEDKGSTFTVEIPIE